MSLTLGAGVTVTVETPGVPTIVTGPPSTSTVLTVPVVGPPGPAGARGGYEHIQSPLAATWTIHHGLNTYPLPTILLTTEPDRPVFTDVQYPDANTVVLTFPSPVSGRAYL